MKNRQVAALEVASTVKASRKIQKLLVTSRAQGSGLGDQQKALALVSQVLELLFSCVEGF